MPAWRLASAPGVSFGVPVVGTGRVSVDRTFEGGVLWQPWIVIITSQQASTARKVLKDMALESGVLYVVATPIGNLDDMTFRAVSVLRSVGTIAAEDTRHSRLLLSHFGIGDKRLVSLHEHNEAGRVTGLVDVLRSGESVALVSDAGTPLVSDPGTQLVRAAWEAGIRLVPVAGASALTTLLSVSPLGAAGVRFAGFLPTKEGARNQFLEALGRDAGPAVFFEAPHRIVSTLVAIAALFPERRILIGRELTKLHEQLLFGRAADLLPDVQLEHRGEFVCLLEGAAEVAEGEDASRKVGRESVIQALRGELPPRAVAKIIARLFGGSTRNIYQELTGDAGDS